MEIYRKLVGFFSITDIMDKSIACNINKILALLSNEDNKKKEYFFTFKCEYCLDIQFSTFQDIKHTEKLANKYSTCAMTYGHFVSSISDLDKKEVIAIDDEFVEKFCDIKFLGILHHRVILTNPESIFSRFQFLTRIDLDENRLDKIPESIFSLETLMSLLIKSNPIKSFGDKQISKEKFSYLKNLVFLELNNLSINESSIFMSRPTNPTDLYSLPKNLTILRLKFMQFDYIPFNLIDCKYTLRKLAFSGVEMIDFDNYSASNAFITLEKIQHKYENLLSSEQITKIFNYYDSLHKGYLVKEEMLRFNAFIFKKFPRIGDDPETDSALGGIPAVIFEMKKLTHLDLSFQSIRFIPDEISELKNLKTLLLSNCVYLETLSPRVAELKLKNIDLTNCLSLKTPPPEIVKRGAVSILSYLKRLSTGKVLCKRTKLMLVGLGEAGKTSLLNSLMSNANTKPELTDGIQIKDWLVELPDKSFLTYSMWDFW